MFKRTMKYVAGIFAAFAVLTVATVNANDHDFMYLNPIGTYQTGIFDESAAEIVAYDHASQRLFFVNSDASNVFVLDISDPTSPEKINEIDVHQWGDGANSVAVMNGIVAVAVEAETKTDNGHVVFFDADGNYINHVMVGALPDAVTFTHDGMNLIVCNEGEPNDDYSVDPVGSVSIVRLENGVENATVDYCGFELWNGLEEVLREEGVRIFGPGANTAMDLEPEYAAVSHDNKRAYITLQENNAFAVIDIPNGTTLAIKALGFKNHMMEGNGIDVSDRDDMINIANWPIHGMYQPDAIATYEVNGKTYVISANEGDARDYDTFSEEERVKDLDLDPDAFPNAEWLQENENLGRKNATTTLGDTDGDGDYDEIYVYGTRSFAIWDNDGNLVWDSGDEFEQVTAQMFPNNFNANNDENDLEGRSDNKGPEPEAVAVGHHMGQHYAFIGLERIGGVMVYNVTDPMNPHFVTYANNRDFSVEDVEENIYEVGDLGPECVLYIPSMHSPNGQNLVVVSNEVSGSVTIFHAIYDPYITVDEVETCRYQAVGLGNNMEEMETAMYGSGDYTYSWHPSEGLDLSDPSNPIVLNPFFDQTYTVTVTDNMTGREVSGHIELMVSESPSLNMANFTFHPRNTPINLNSKITSISGGEAPYMMHWSDRMGQMINDPTNVFPPVGISAYDLMVTDEKGCLSNTRRLHVFVSPRKDLAEEDYAVGANGEGAMAAYPNPVVNEVNVFAIFNNSAEVNVKVSDLEGNYIKGFSTSGDVVEEKIDLGGLASGVYLITLDNGFDTIVKKVIKQ
jgi:hypothetical protein